MEKYYPEIIFKKDEHGAVYLFSTLRNTGKDGRFYKSFMRAKIKDDESVLEEIIKFNKLCYLNMDGVIDQDKVCEDGLNFFKLDENQEGEYARKQNILI